METYNLYHGQKAQYDKTSILNKLVYRVFIILIKIPADFTVEIDRLMLKCIWKCKEPTLAKTILKKKNKEPTLPCLKTI